MRVAFATLDVKVLAIQIQGYWKAYDPETGVITSKKVDIFGEGTFRGINGFSVVKSSKNQLLSSLVDHRVGVRLHSNSLILLG